MSNLIPDYYAILGIDPAATEEEIYQAYLAKSGLNSPEQLRQEKEGYMNTMRNRNLEPLQTVLDIFDNRIQNAQENQKVIDEAYQLLSSEESRSEYDRLRPRQDDPRFDLGNVPINEGDTRPIAVLLPVTPEPAVVEPPAPVQPETQPEETANPHARRNRRRLGCALLIVIGIITIPSLCRYMTRQPMNIILSQGGGIIQTSTPEIFEPTLEPNSMRAAQSMDDNQELNVSNLSKPQWSADGLFISWQSPEGIVIMSSDVSTYTLIETDLGRSSSPIKWSPTKQEIVYVYDDSEEENSGLWLMTIDGKKKAIWRSQQPQANDDPIDFDWSPDGKKIVFSFQDELYTIDYDGRNLTPLSLTVPAKKPLWSPDGQFISFESVMKGNGSHISIVAVINADGTEPRTVQEAHDTARWIRSSNKLVANKDGGVETIIFASPFTQGEQTIEGRYAVFSPTGDMYLSYMTDHVVLYPSKTPISEKMFNENDWSAAWSPDGSKFAITLGQHSYLYQKDGSLIREIT